MARPEEYTPEQVAIALRKSAGIVTHAASFLGTTPQTVRRYIREHDICAEAKGEALENALDMAETNVMKGLKAGDKTFTIFYLKTMGKHRGWIEGRELTGPGGGPIQAEVEQVTIDVDKLTPAERLALLKAVRDAPEPG